MKHIQEFRVTCIPLLATHSQCEFLLFDVPELIWVPHKCCVLNMGPDQGCIQLYQGITARELVIASIESRPMIFLALLHTHSICGDHDVSEEMKTPRYLKVGTSSSTDPFNVRGEAARLGFVLLEILMHLHLLVSLRVIVFTNDQLLMQSISD